MVYTSFKEKFFENNFIVSIAPINPSRNYRLMKDIKPAKEKYHELVHFQARFKVWLGILPSKKIISSEQTAEHN